MARVALLLALLYLLYAALAALLVDAWGSQLLSSQLQQRTGHAASVEQMHFNPFTNQLTLSGVTLGGADGTILAIEHLTADIKLAPLLDGKFYLSRLELDAPSVQLVRQADGRFNLQQLLASITGSDQAPAADQAPVVGQASAEVTSDTASGFILTPVVAQLQVRQGRLEFTDNSLLQPAVVSLTHIDISATDVSLAAGHPFEYQAAFDLATAGQVSVDGKAQVAPRTLQAAVAMQQLNLKQGAPWVQQLTGLRLTGGQLSGDTNLQVSNNRWRITGATHISDLALRGNAGSTQLKVDSLALDNLDLQHEKEGLEARAGVVVKAARLQSVTGKPLAAIASLEAPDLAFQQIDGARKLSGVLNVDGWQDFGNQPHTASSTKVSTHHAVRLALPDNPKDDAAKPVHDTKGDVNSVAESVAESAVGSRRLVSTAAAIEPAAEPKKHNMTATLSLANWRWPVASRKPLLDTVTLLASGVKRDAKHRADHLINPLVNKMTDGVVQSLVTDTATDIGAVSATKGATSPPELQPTEDNDASRDSMGGAATAMSAVAAGVTSVDSTPVAAAVTPTVVSTTASTVTRAAAHNATRADRQSPQEANTAATAQTSDATEHPAGTADDDAAAPDAAKSQAGSEADTAREVLKKKASDVSSEKNLEQVFEASRKQYSLLKSGGMDMTLSGSYTYYGNQAIDIHFNSSGSLDRFRIVNNAQHSFGAALSFDYGIWDNLTFNTYLPVVYQYDTEKNVSKAALGDVSFGFRYQPFPVISGGVNTTLYGTLSTATGDSPYKIDPNTEVSSGKGYYSLGGGVSLSRVIDPVVLFGSVGYTLALNATGLNQIRSSRILNKVEPGDSVSLSFGLAYALSYDVSLSGSYQQSYNFSSKYYFHNGDVIKSEDSTTGVMNMSLGLRTASDRIVNLSFGFGLTPDSPDVMLGFSLPVDITGLKAGA